MQFKNAEVDDDNVNVKKIEKNENSDDDSDILDGFLQGYNETEEGNKQSTVGLVSILAN